MKKELNLYIVLKSIEVSLFDCYLFLLFLYFQNIFKTTEFRATLQILKAFFTSFIECKLKTVPGVFSENTDFFGELKFPWINPRWNRLSIHSKSFVSSLLPFTVLIHLGLAMDTLIQYSKKLKTGIQHLLVAFMYTSVQLLLSSHCLKWQMSELKVEKCCLWQQGPRIIRSC